MSTPRPSNPVHRAAQSAALIEQERSRKWLEDHPMTVGTGLDRDPVTRREAERLASEHGDAPSGCRFCGRTTRTSAEDLAGWRLCHACAVIDRTVPGPRTALWRVLLADATIDRDEADQLSEKLGEIGFWVGRWATDEGVARRWGHLADHVIPAAVEHLRFIRSQQGLTRSPSETGCSWCGAFASVDGWIDTEHTFASGQRGYICGACKPTYERSGGEIRGEWLLAEIVGSKRAVMGVTFDVVPFIDARPEDVAGTEEPWQYLGDIRAELRRRWVRLYERDATPAERAEIAT
jgi:hypothetical protein